MGSPWETDVGVSDGADGGGRGEPPGADEGTAEERLLMSPGGYAAAAVALLAIGLAGFFSNLLVMVLMCKNKQLWTPLNSILFNLVCSDFSVSVLGNPMTLTAALFRRWIFGQSMCVIYGFFMSLLGIASITTLMVLSFERYVMISKPFQVRRLSQKGALALIGAIWIYSLILTTPPLFGWGDYVNESANISCSVNWESKSFSATTYIIFLFAMGLVVPVIVICFSYLNIIRTMKKSAVTMGRVTKAESRVAFMVFVMIVAFLVAWTPYSVFALLVAFGDASLISPGVAVVPALMAKSSICYNPVIYVGLNTQFRSAWRKLLGVRPTSETSQEVGGEHTAMLSPSHYLSHTLLEGSAGGNAVTASTSASGILVYNSSNASTKGNAVAVALKRRAAAPSTGANGEAARPPPPAGNRTKISGAVPEEEEEVAEEEEAKGEEEENEEEGVKDGRVPRDAVTSPGNGCPESRLDGGAEEGVRVGGKGKRLRGGGFPRGKGRKVGGCLGGEGFRGPRKAPGGAGRGSGEGGRGRKGRQFLSGGGRKAIGKGAGGDGLAAQEPRGAEGDVEMKMLSVTEPTSSVCSCRQPEGGDVVAV